VFFYFLIRYFSFYLIIACILTKEKKFGETEDINQKTIFELEHFSFFATKTKRINVYFLKMNYINHSSFLLNLYFDLACLYR